MNIVSLLYSGVSLAMFAAGGMVDNKGQGNTGGMDTKGGTVGGGEALQFYDNGDKPTPQGLDESTIKSFLALPYVRAAIIVLILVAALLLIMQIFKIRNPLKGKTLSRELGHLANVKKRDASILRANNMIRTFTNIVEHSPLAMPNTNKEYWAYNLNRANIRIPGKSRIMKPEEFNAIVMTAATFVCALGIAFAILFNFFLGALIILATVLIANTFPMIFIRNAVREKDTEIQEHFTDLYLMLHYVLLASASTPISGIMKSFDKTTESDEMHRFIDSCVHFIDTYGEYEATKFISREFREIPQVCKLMRLVRQANEGGDIRAELQGFREELLEAKRYAMEKRMEKMIAKARASFNILLPVLVQAVLSAMAIYMDDLSIASTLFG